MASVWAQSAPASLVGRATVAPSWTSSLRHQAEQRQPSHPPQNPTRQRGAGEVSLMEKRSSTTVGSLRWADIAACPCGKACRLAGTQPARLWKVRTYHWSKAPSKQTAITHRSSGPRMGHCSSSTSGMASRPAALRLVLILQQPVRMAQLLHRCHTHRRHLGMPTHQVPHSGCRMAWANHGETARRCRKVLGLTTQPLISFRTGR